MRHFSRLVAVLAASAALFLGLVPGTVVHAAAAPKLAVSPGTPIRGDSFTVSGSLTTKVARPVQLQYKSGKKWKRMADSRATPEGKFSFTISTSKTSLTLRVVAGKTTIKVKGKKKTFKKIVTKSRTIKTKARPLKAVAMDTGTFSSCAITDAGGVWCWGENSNGELGDGTRTARVTPAPVKGLPGRAVAISTGDSHSCALLDAGTIWCWGANFAGALGDGTTTRRTTPVQVKGLVGATAISAGGDHTCALDQAGGAWCWGGNVSGQLGDGTTTNRTTPVRVTGLSGGVAAVSATDGWHTCAATTSGAALCWGQNNNGQLGDATTERRTVPTPVVGLSSGVTGLSGGERGTCAVTSAGIVTCWGYRGYKGDSGDARLPAVNRNLAPGVTAVTAGYQHRCALISGRAVECWGFNDATQVGPGDYEDYKEKPLRISGLSNPIAVSAGGDHTCVLVSGGAIKCWGAWDNGALGYDAATQATPRFVKGFGG